MDFLAICQGLGLALAAGLIIGVAVPPVMPGWGAAAGAAPLGFLACAAALRGEDEPIWPAVPVGVLGATFAAVVVHDVAAGASRRERSGSGELGEAPPTASVQLVAWVVLAAAILALASIFVPPISLAAAAALAWLWLSRRRRAERKHEGLRVLR